MTEHELLIEQSNLHCAFSNLLVRLPRTIQGKAVRCTTDKERHVRSSELSRCLPSALESRIHCKAWRGRRRSGRKRLLARVNN